MNNNIVASEKVSACAYDSSTPGQCESNRELQVIDVVEHRLMCEVAGTDVIDSQYKVADLDPGTLSSTAPSHLPHTLFTAVAYLQLSPSNVIFVIF